MRIYNGVGKPSTLVDEGDYSVIEGYSWCVSVAGYAVARDRKTGKVIYMHRLLLNNPKGIVDHKNGDKLDNRRSNLRLCTNAENSRNQKIRSNNTSGFKGVSKDGRRQKWMAYIRTNYKRKFLGYYNSPEEASRAYESAALELHEDFARLA